MKPQTALPLAAFVGSLVWGSSASADPLYEKCINSTSTNSEWAGCGGDYLERLDKALSVAWKKAMSSLGDKQSRAELLHEQRAWITFQDASCKFYANGSFGREGQVLHFYGCRAGVVEARISDLNIIYQMKHQN